ncbi:MAG: hypothetical protein WD960_09720 [Gemmatimonadota bacterium]
MSSLSSLPYRGRTALLLLPLLVLSACAPAQDDPDDRLVELREELSDRFTPGLHTLMVDLGMRHASLWFAGEAENWPLADYMSHELEELVGEIEELHPVYDEVQVAAMIREMTHPAMEALEDAVEDGDRAAFVEAHDRLTQACNACHTASNRAALVIQRPTAPPLTNLRYSR